MHGVLNKSPCYFVFVLFIEEMYRKLMYGTCSLFYHPPHMNTYKSVCNINQKVRDFKLGNTLASEAFAYALCTMYAKC